MASKAFLLDDGLPVTVYKRRGSRNLRLSVGAEGKVRVTIPAWTPYKVGIDFARARHQWILQQQKPANLLTDGQAIGKAHRLQFETAPEINKITTRVNSTSITVRYPEEFTESDFAVQKAASAASVKALRKQAEVLLPQRLDTLASTHGFEYKTVVIKKLKGRWGSCDSQQNIVLNLYLMQLPWELIDYVILHELTHTRILRHGPDFWSAMREVLPASRELRKKMRGYHPALNGSA